MIVGAILGFIMAALVLATGALAAYSGKKYKKTTSAVCGILCAIFVIGLVIVPLSFRTVDTGEVAVVKYLGKAKNVRTAGTYFDLWLTNTYDRYDAKVQDVEITTSAYSSDAQTMDIQMTLQYQIMTDRVINIAEQYGSLDVLQNRIESIAIEKAKSVLSSYKAMDIISDRASMSPRVEEAIKNAIVEEYHVTIATVVLTNIDFSDAFELAVEEKMIAEQKQLQAEYENQTKIAAAEAEAKAAVQKAEGEAKAKLIAATADKEAQIEIARAEAEAIKLKSIEVARALGFNIKENVVTDAEGVEVIEFEIDFTDRTPEEISIIATYLQYIEYLEKWDGKLPTVVTGDSASIMIPTNPVE